MQTEMKRTLTDGCKDIGKTEVIHGIKGQEVVKELLLFIIAAQESIALVQLSRKKNMKGKLQNNKS